MMRHWNLVFLRYCDGISFSGTAGNVTHPDGTSLHFGGTAIWEAALTDMMVHLGLKGATDVIVGGCSAGALASLMYCDWYGDRIRSESTTAHYSVNVGALLGCRRLGSGASKHGISLADDGRYRTASARTACTVHGTR